VTYITGIIDGATSVDVIDQSVVADVCRCVCDVFPMSVCLNFDQIGDLGSCIKVLCFTLCVN